MLVFSQQGEILEEITDNELILNHNSFIGIYFINPEQVCTQYREYLYLYLCQWKCNHMDAINHVYIKFITKKYKYTFNN